MFACLATVQRKLRYLLGAPTRRWNNETDEIFLLEMLLKTRVVRQPATVVKKWAWDEVVAQFARQREVEDEEWRGRDYASAVGKYLRSGDWHYMLMDGDRGVGIVNASRGPCFISPVRHWVRLPEKVVGFYDVYTTPVHRGRGYYPALFNTAVNDCVTMGYQRAWMWIMPHNIRSLKVHNQLGMSHVFRRIVHRQRWGFRWHRFESLDTSAEELFPGLFGTVGE